MFWTTKDISLIGISNHDSQTVIQFNQSGIAVNLIGLSVN